MSWIPKLTREQALAIREAYTAGSLMQAVARQHGVSRTTVSNVVKGRYSAVADLPDIARVRTPERGPAPPCGTTRGYEYHRRHGELVDQECRAAASVSKRAFKRRAAVRRRCELNARESALEAKAHGHPGSYEDLYADALLDEMEAAGGAL